MRRKLGRNVVEVGEARRAHRAGAGVVDRDEAALVARAEAAELMARCGFATLGLR